MTHQKQHPGYNVNSITFYNPPHNSHQTTAVNQQPLQYVTYTPLISSPSSSTVGASIAPNLSHYVHPTMQAHPPSSTVNLQQLPPQFFHLYTTAPFQNPQFVIPSFTHIPTDVKVAKVASTEVKDVSSSSANTMITNDKKNVSSSSNTSPAIKNVKVVSSSSNTSSAIKNVKVVSSSSNTSPAIKNVKVVPSSSNTPTSTDVKDVKAVLPSSNTPLCISTTNKKNQRLEKNRLAARECRERRKAYILNLENRTTKLEEENFILRQKIQELTTKLELMKYINQDNIRLENLVKELKNKVMEQDKDKCARVIVIDDNDNADIGIVKIEPEDR